MYDQLPNPKVAEAISQSSLALYKQQGGHMLDDNIEAMHRTILLYNKELDRAEAWTSEEKFKWRVSPSEAIRASNQFEKLRKERIALMDECYKIARELVENELQARAARHQPAAPANPPAQAASAPTATSAPPAGHKHAMPVPGPSPTETAGAA